MALGGIVIEERSRIVAEVTGESGETKHSMVDMPASYMPTVTASVEVVSKALNDKQNRISATGVRIRGGASGCTT